jgi:hypothetical protein
MTISEPSSRPAKPLAVQPWAVQPWAVSLAGVVAILALLVAITL